MRLFIINIIDLIVLDLEIGTQRLVLEGKPLHQLINAVRRFPKDELFPQNKHLREIT